MANIYINIVLMSVVNQQYVFDKVDLFYIDFLLDL